MKKLLLVLSLFAAGTTLAESYVGIAGALTLPSGGARVRCLGGAGMRLGTYFGDFLAAEGEGAWQEDAAALVVRGLWHWQGAELYNRFFGYSQFDPFFTFGARGLIAHREGEVGPMVGLGTFYHLTDNWSLRFDADFTLGLDTEVVELYAVAFGVQYAF